jgi:hypothetical protein
MTPRDTSTSRMIGALRADLEAAFPEPVRDTDPEVPEPVWTALDDLRALENAATEIEGALETMTATRRGLLNALLGIARSIHTAVRQPVAA